MVSLNTRQTLCEYDFKKSGIINGIDHSLKKRVYENSIPIDMKVKAISQIKQTHTLAEHTTLTFPKGVNIIQL